MYGCMCNAIAPSLLVYQVYGTLGLYSQCTCTGNVIQAPHTHPLPLAQHPTPLCPPPAWNPDWAMDPSPGHTCSYGSYRGVAIVHG
mmetsp:Transcript_145877/g.254673  ORF Transcript_145877/g.254673 Transcript_145877/m.254673 type:complete len:86 (-) Transcript_145877:363-620(-)